MLKINHGFIFEFFFFWVMRSSHYIFNFKLFFERKKKMFHLSIKRFRSLNFNRKFLIFYKYVVIPFC